MFIRAIYLDAMLFDDQEEVKIGIMSDNYIKKKYPGKKLPSFEERKEKIKDCILDLEPTFAYFDFIVKFFEQDDPEFMPQMNKGDVLIVSKETLPHALKLLEGYVEWPMLSVVPMIVDEHGEEYHSRNMIK